MRPAAAVLAALLCVVAAGCAGMTGSDADAARTIEVFGPYRGLEADRFSEVVQRFEHDSGVDVRYVGSVDFVSDLQLRVGEGNDPPDVAVVPQPGLVRELAGRGAIVPLDAATQAAIGANYPAATARLARIDDVPYGVPFRLTLKSLVWYRPAVFAEHGWAVPRTLDELDRLAARIADESDLAPWCFGMASGTATGWAATDWVEDLVLRLAGTETYRSWAVGETGFADPAVAAAFDRFRALVLAPGRVAGGLTGVVQTPVDEAAGPLFGDPPGCALYKQADFAQDWFPDGTTIGPDADLDVFPLPGAEPAQMPPLLVGGDQAVQFRRDPTVDAFMAYLAGPAAGASWAHHGGFLSPKSSIPEDAYPPGLPQRLAAVLAGVTTLAFDASDQMPPNIGSSLLWSSITDWVTGVVDYAAFAATMDDARAAQAAAPP